MAVDNNNVRLAAANMLLDRGVRYKISATPLFLRLLRINSINIRPLRAGTLMEISRLVDERKLDEIENVEDIHKQLNSIAELVAIAILNGKWKIKYLKRMCTRLLLWSVPISTLLTIFYHVVQVNKLSDFMNITKYFAHQAAMIMSPRNLGQQGKGN